MTARNDAPAIRPEVEALALAALAKRVKELDQPVRSIFKGDYDNGRSQKFRSPVDGRALGSVYREDPDPEWRVVDPTALHAHLRAHGHEETVYELDDALREKVVEVLREHAPELLIERTLVPQEAVEETLTATRKAGEPVDPDGNAAPGVEWVKPEGRLVVKPDPNAGEVAAAMVRAGSIDWSRRPELGAGS